MKTKVITVATRPDVGLTNLIRSMDAQGIPLEILGMETAWKGFGTKIILLKNYLRELDKEYTHFIFVDAYDVVFLNDLQHIESLYNKFFEDQLVFSAEKNCWPDPDLFSLYPQNDSRWKYLNSGSYMGRIDTFLELINDNPIDFHHDDQRYFTDLYIKGKDIKLDYNCEIFQPYSFVAKDEFDIRFEGIMNKITNTYPSIIHGNGKSDMTEIYKMADWTAFNTLQSVGMIWQPTVEYNKRINEYFIERVNDYPILKAHRDFVESRIWGFGERSFYWMWKLLIQKMDKDFTFLEIGVFKGAILSVVQLIAEAMGKNVTRYGVTPLSSAEVGWESNYGEDIKTIHEFFKQPLDYTIIQGDSTDPAVIERAKDLTLDILYIDGCHSKFCVQSDIKNYCPLLKVGGYLVIDDSACRFPMPFGYFTGISTVCEGVDELLPPGVKSDEYEHLFNIVHNRVWKKIK